MSGELSNKFADMLKSKGILAGIQMLCPIELNFKLLANMKYKGKIHDLTVLLAFSGTAQLMQQPSDIEAFIRNLLGDRNSTTKIVCDKVKYDKQMFFAVFIDRPETP